MTLDEYQTDARKLAIYPGRHFFVGTIYCALKLAGEAGEIAQKIGKAMRDDFSRISDERRMALIDELGDVLWYVANLAAEQNFTLDEVAARNLRKLQDRERRGVLKGDGDKR